MAHVEHADAMSSEHLTYRSYVTGFLGSLTLTLAAYVLVRSHTGGQEALFSHPWILGAVAVLALIQFGWQIYFFLHLGQENQPRWKLLILIFMLIIVLILVGGSIWIMYNLNTRMMPSPTQINNYMQQQGGGV